MVKLSQQLDVPIQSLQDRQTRTQRVSRIQEIVRQKRIEDARVKQQEQLQQKAQQIQEEQFTSKTKTETYTEYKSKDYSWQRWASADPQTKQRILDKTPKSDLDSRQATRTVTIPFTYELEGENTYAQIYAKLDPELKPLFQIPTSAKQSFETAKQTQIDTNVERIKEQVVGAESQIQYYKDKIERLRKEENELGKDRGDAIDQANRELSYAMKYRDEYKKAIGQAQTGFSYDSIIANAEGTAFAYQQRVEGRVADVVAYQKLIKSGDPFVNVYKDAFKQYQSLSTYEKARTKMPDFSSASTLSSLRQQKWLQTYEPLSQKLLASGKTDEPIVKTYKSIIGEQRFGTIQTQIKASQDKAISQYMEQSKLKLRIKEDQPLDILDQWPIKKGTIISGETRGPVYETFVGDVFLDLKKIDVSEHGYLTKGTIRSDIDYSKPIYDFLPITIAPIEDKGKSLFTKLLDKTGDINIPLFAITGGSLKVRDLTDPLKEVISEKKQEQFEKEITRTGLKARTGLQFQQEYQTRFDRKYMADIIRGKIDFETASEEFAKSEDARIIQEKHRIAIEEGRRGKFTTEGFAIAGLSLAGLGVMLIPETYGELGIDVAVIGGATLVAPHIPTLVSTGVTAGFGIYGTAQALSPLSSPEEKAGGVITAGISFGALGLQGVRYFKQPTVKTVKIKPPKISLKTYAVGKEGKVYQITTGGKTGTAEIVSFGKQKLSQTAIAGRRTIISTKGRDLVRRIYQELGIKDIKVLDKGLSGPIYKGIPSAQRGTTFTVKGIRGTTTITTPSARQKALDLLVKRGGMTKAQAQATLRYYAPKVIDITLEKGNLLILNTEKGQKAIGRFTFLTEQPKLAVDKTLGINTRSAKTIRDVFDIERKLQGSTKLGFDKLTENIRKTTMFVNKQGGSFNLLRQAGRTTTISKSVSIADAKDPSKAFLKRVLKTEFGDVTQKIPFEFQEIRSAYLRQQIIPTSRRIDFGTSRTDLIKRLKTDKVIKIDIDKIRGVSYLSDDVVAKVKIKKTPFSKTFGVDTNIEEVKNVIKNINKGTSVKPTISNVDDIVDRITDIKQSEYYGKGVAGPDQVFIDSKFSTQSLGLTQTSQQLKIAVDPILNIKTNIKEIVLINQGVKGALLSASVSGASLRAGLKFDTGLKESINLKDMIKTDVSIKQTPAIKSALKSSTSLKSILRSSLDIKSISKSLTAIPKFDIPPPTPIPAIIIFPEILEQKMRAKKKAKQVQDLLFLPDFTSRALGLKEVVISEKQAQAQLKKILTGLEIRRPTRVKF